MLSPEAPDTSTLIDLFNIYEFSQLIDEPTRVTSSSRIPVDFCVTIGSQKIVNSASRILELVNHSLVYFIRKKHCQPLLHALFNHGCLKILIRINLNVKPWHEISSQINPNCMWDIWKALKMECIDKHAPARRRRVGKKEAPWMTNELQNKMHVRNYLKKQAVNLNDSASWDKYKLLVTKLIMQLSMQKSNTSVQTLNIKIILVKRGNLLMSLLPHV